MAKRRKKRTQPQKKRWTAKRWAVLAAAILVPVALAAFLAFFTLRDDGSSQPAEGGTIADVSLDKSVGPEDAPVVVVEYGDFQ
ncbi:MAG: hypothetical protein GXP42_06810 [Chloroflexi bacterium]|nr:hypothetical protein [Chloroflexota bacterium]